MLVFWLLKHDLIFKLEEIFKLGLTENHLQDPWSDIITGRSCKQEAYYKEKLLAGPEHVKKTYE